MKTAATILAGAALVAAQDLSSLPQCGVSYPRDSHGVNSSSPLPFNAPAQLEETHVTDNR